MTNQIHDFELHSCQGWRWSPKEARLEGYETSRSRLQSLLSLFMRAEYNVLYKERPSGPAYVLDLTADQRNLRVCSFDTEEMLTGWYALKSISYSPQRGKLNYYPYVIQLIYVGSISNIQQWYSVLDMAELSSNDWGI